MAMAEASLFPESRFLRNYPKLLPFTRITLNRFQLRPFMVRHARSEDLESLILLEHECWDEAMRASGDRLARRIARFPEGQFVLETSAGIAGVLYTQRIADPKRLETARDDNVEDLFERSGRYAQLITVNVSPNQQQRGLGDQLLEFVLQVLSTRGGIERAVGVTRCRDYAEHSMPLGEYVRLRGEDGTPVDPILQFHDAHGAAILKLLPGYRPADTDNDGCGVLIEYDLRRRQSKHAVQFANSAIGDTMDDGPIELVVASTIKEILAEDADDYSATTTLLDLGMDSMSMLELRTMLSRHFQQDLDSTFLFEHDTAEAIIDYFSR
jgi:acyl carrier protein/ribosomal protein S18 acetylase RimI-like enzyme